MTYFTISEMIASDTAKAKGIDNSPTTEVRANLVALIETLLDPLREAWKKAELRKQERTMSIILENKDDIAKMIAELIKKQSDGNA